MRKQYSLTKEHACALFGKTRQGYDKVHKVQVDRAYREKKVLNSVNEIRDIDPGIGGYKLWLMAHDMFDEEWVPGRDSFYAILRQRDLVLPKPKPRTTTNSNHRYHKYKNLIKDFKPKMSNELWVSDITYIDLDGDCCYLHLVTDAYSHKIVGWCLAESLAAMFTLEALRIAIKQAGKDDLTGLIHHSGRGTQYCCNAYVELLYRHNITISMTEDYKPTDNGIAERVNGIIKTELIYKVRQFKNIKEAKAKIKEFIEFYNERRPHMSIGYQTPSEVHKQSGPQKKYWKKKVYSSKTNTFASPDG